MYEVQADGKEAPWGTVDVWEPPHRLVISWHVNPEAPAPTEIEVRFIADGDATRVDVEHRGWERLGMERGRAAREATALTTAGASCSRATPRRPARPRRRTIRGWTPGAHPRGGRRGGSARHRRMRRLPGRAVRPHRGADPRAPRPPASSPTCASPWPTPSARAIPRRCFGAPARSSPPPGATRGPSRRSLATARAGACRATPAATSTPCCASSSPRSGSSSAGWAPGSRSAVFVDANHHVDREAAARSGIAVYGKNTLAITRRHGSWVVLGVLVTDAELEPTQRRGRRAGLGRVRIVPGVHRRLPDRRDRRRRRARRPPAA